MSDERVHDRINETSLEGVRCSFRAYLDEEGEPRLVWKIGKRRGNDAKFDAKEAMVFLPAGVRVAFNGRNVSAIDLPRWLGDALANDFADLESDSEC